MLKKYMKENKKRIDFVDNLEVTDLFSKIFSQEKIFINQLRTRKNFNLIA